MKVRLSVFLATIGVALTVAIGSAQAQKVDVGFAKGDSVVLAIPRVLARVSRTGLLGTNMKRDFEIAHDAEGHVIVKDTTGKTYPNWRQAGFPSLLPFQVRNVKTVTRLDKTQVIELSLRNEGGDVRVFAPVDQGAAFREVIAPATASDSVRTAAYKAMGEAFFTGPLQVFSPDERTTLLTWADLTASSSRIGHERYKDVTYLVIDLPRDSNIWNDLRVSRSKRIGKLLNDQFLLLKTFAKLSLPHGTIGGLKLEKPSCHGTAPNYRDQRCDPIEAYLPLDQLLKFREAAITSQQLLNASILLDSGDRIEVDLRDQ